MGAKDGDIYYLTDMDEGMGDLYCNEELIDSDVMIGTLEFTKEQKYPIYKTDYNTSKNLFTLKMFDGKNAKVIADDAFDYKVVDEKKIPSPCRFLMTMTLRNIEVVQRKG